MPKALVFGLVLIMLVTGMAVDAAENSPAGDVAITVYNGGVGLVKEVRRLKLKPGISEVAISDVAALIDPTSVHFESLTENGARVLEQNFEYDLINQERLLSRYLGREIELVSEEGSRTVTLLSCEGGRLVVKDGDSILLDPPGRVRLPALPEGLMTRPTLKWLVESSVGSEQLVQISYLTEGLSWRADYIAVVDDDNDLSLSGWVTITNNSGATYKDAELKLVAGDVNLVRHGQQVPGLGVERKDLRAAADPQFRQEQFFEYHLYDLKRKTTVKDRQVKQIGLLDVPRAKAVRTYVVEGSMWEGSSERPAKVMLELENTANNGLGMPLPAGKVRVYKEDSEGSLQFVGENLIDHTPAEEKIQLYLGNAFDIRAIQTTLHRRERKDDYVEILRRIELRNHKDQAVELVVVQKTWNEWEVLDSEEEYTRRDANTLEFKVTVPAGGERVFTYRALLR